MWNEVFLVGRLGQEVEVKRTSNGMAVASFQLANQGPNDKTNWIKCSAFDKVCENFAQYVHKGDKVAVKGRIQSGEYVNKDNKKVTTMEIVVTSFQLFGKIEKSEPELPESPRTAKLLKTTYDRPEPIIDPDSDLPF